MQGKYDKRACKDSIRPEHQHGNYLDTLVDTAAKWFEPYAKNLVVIASGNHEESIRKNHETDLIERLVARLNGSGGGVWHGGFAGWVSFRFRAEGGGPWRTIRLHYDHGYGGGGAVTRDVIQGDRRAVYTPDADILVSGHTHDLWTMGVARARISPAGVPYQDMQWRVKIPSYKEEYVDGYGGWHARRGAPPKPIGAIWLRFSFDPREERVCVTPEFAG
jgi:predicted phosphodiesterase